MIEEAKGEAAAAAAAEDEEEEEGYTITGEARCIRFGWLSFQTRGT